MSIDNRQCVRSKYFVGQTAMDESLSDFQEAKPSCKGPKPVQKPNKPKTRKVTKRIKGQKDIRTALNGKKNELISYSKDFDTVCKKSGLDVDSEQLQLAIALSKSLQTESASTPESSQTTSSQARVAKIRKTLQEYGFKVPEAKITNKRTKKLRKHYKLLTITEEERHQKITSKYSQVLFENLDCSKFEHDFINQDTDARIFYVASNIPYECLKDNTVFYVDNLIEKSTTCGYLLRDWSEIPGRPESPKLFDTNTMNFREIDCSQDELDVVLSGSIKSAKDIMATKQTEHKNKYGECVIPRVVIDDDDENLGTNDNVATVDINNSPTMDDNYHLASEKKSPFQKAFELKSPIKKTFEIKSPHRKVQEASPGTEVIEIKSPDKEVMVNRKLFQDEVIDVEAHNKLTFPPQYRSCSPDIFDDELSSILEVSKPANVLSQEHKTKVFNEDNFMDLTQCANVLSQNTEKSCLLSQNITKRKSNDFMEITECMGSSQPIREECKEIDLTQSPENKDAKLDENHSTRVDIIDENISLGQSFNYNEQNENGSVSQDITDEQNETVVLNQPQNINEHQIPKDNIDLTQSSNEDGNRIIDAEENGETIEDMDLTQSSNSSYHTQDLPLVNIGNSQTVKSLDDTVLINEDEYLGLIGKKSMVFENKAHSEVFDLTEAKDTSIEYNSSPLMKRNTEACSNSFYEDFVHDHSGNTENSQENAHNIVSYERSNNSHDTKSKEPNDIDLTQGSDTSEEHFLSPKPITVLQNNPNNSSLGKRDDVSIDYDEIIIDENICDKEGCKESDNDNSLMLKYDSSKSEVYNDVEIVDTNNECDINSSQNSEVFNISDKELDYSMHKSRYDIPRDNFDFGGISILDDVTKLSFRKSLSEGNYCSLAANKNCTVEDSFLPEVYIKKTDNKNMDVPQIDTQISKVLSPLKVQDLRNKNNGAIKIHTPKNTEYIIKTDDVTPMADYAAMSTPERNRELDKYGLKPFKRKRAIQLLTHIYNQTHPTVQQLVDEFQPSPSKKAKHDTNIHNVIPNNPTTSPKTSLSQDLILTTPRKLFTKKSPRKTCSQSPIKTAELERDGRNFCSQSPRKSEKLKRDRQNFSAPSPKNSGDKDVCVYEVTSEAADVRSIDCNPDDWVFQKREKAKVHSCRVPLHIAFHNYVSSRRSLREAILKYEPVNIDVIHKDLVGYGHRYDPKDLLKFLDKKCITVKTTDNNSRNVKR